MINPISPQRAAVMAVLQQASEPMCVAEIATATGMKPHDVGMMLLRMRTDGQAQYVFRGSLACWQVVPPQT